MRLIKFISGVLLVLFFSKTTAQTDFEMNEIRPIVSLSFNNDPFSVYSLGKEFNLPVVDIFRDKFAERPKINMVEAANRKAYIAQQKQEQNFSFIERQTAIFSSFTPKFDNSSSSPLAPSYHEQPIYSDLNRVKNSAYEDLGDKYRRMSPFYQFSPYRRSNRSGLYFSRY